MCQVASGCGSCIGIQYGRWSVGRVPRPRRLVVDDDDDDDDDDDGGRPSAWCAQTHVHVTV